MSLKWLLLSHVTTSFSNWTLNASCGLGLGPERGKQASGRARGAGGKEERDEWCRSRGSVDKSRSMKELDVCLFRLLCDRDSSVCLGTRIYIPEIPRVVVLRPSTPFRLRQKKYCACVRNYRLFLTVKGMG